MDSHYSCLGLEWSLVFWWWLGPGLYWPSLDLWTCSRWWKKVPLRSSKTQWWVEGWFLLGISSTSQATLSCNFWNSCCNLRAYVLLDHTITLILLFQIILKIMSIFTNPILILGSALTAFLTHLFLQSLIFSDVPMLTDNNNLNILQSHPRCGITTGGREECWWNCSRKRTRFGAYVFTVNISHW